MDDLHVIVLTTGDAVFVGLLAAALVVFVVMAVWVVGHNAGVRAHRRFVSVRDEADMADAAATFGPRLSAAILSQPGERATLRRIK